MFKFFLKFTFLSFFSFSILFSMDLDDIKKRGELRHLGILYANFVTGSGDGLDVELMKGFAKYLGVEYKFVETSWNSLFGDLTGRNAKNGENGVVFLNNGPIKGDIIANGLTILDWRKEVVAFSTPTFPSGVWLVARSDSKLNPIRPTNSQEEDVNLVKKSLDGKTVLVIENTCLDPKLYDLEKTNAKIKPQSQDVKLNELVPVILSKKAETTLLDVPDALIALEKWPGEIKIIGPISFDQRMGVAFRKNSPNLLSEFNKYFKKIKNDGTYNKLVEKYYPDVFYYYGSFFK